MADEDVKLTDNPEFRRIAGDMYLAADDLGVDLKKAGIFERSAVNVVGYLVSYLGKKIGNILDWVGFGLEQLEGKASLIFTPFMARLVGHALGADVSSADITERLNRAGSSAIGNVTAQTVFDMLAPPDGTLEPGDAGAKRMVGALGHMTVNNWAEGLTLEWLAEYFGWDIDLKALPELAQQLINNMGLNRLARTALRPLAHIVVATPLQWKLNKQYRPKMLGVAEAAAAVLRGDLDEATFLEIAQRDGYGDDAIAIIMRATRKNVSPADAYLLFQLGLKDQAWTIAQLRAGGLDADEAETVFHLQEAKSLRAYQLEAAQSAVTAYGDRRIEDLALADELDHLGLDQTTLDRFHAEASRRRRLSVLHLTRADVEQAVVLEVLSTSDYADWLHARGYGENDALTLELMLQAKLNKLDDAKTARAAAAAARAADRAAKGQAARARRDAIASEHAHWTGTLGEAERLVVRQVMPTNQYRQILIDHNLSAGDADALVTVAVQDRDARTAAGAKRAAAAAKNPTPALALSTLERATIMGALSVQELGAELATRKYDAVDAAIIIDLVNDAIAARQAALARTAAAAAKLTSRGLNLAQVQKAVVDGVQSLAQYSAFLTAQKFDATSIATLVADMQVQLNNRALANERHAAAVAKLEASHLSLAEEEKAVVKGILTLADYQGYLVAHDFDAADVAILTALLETKLPTAGA